MLGNGCAAIAHRTAVINMKTHAVRRSAAFATRHGIPLSRSIQILSCQPKTFLPELHDRPRSAFRSKLQWLEFSNPSRDHLDRTYCNESSDARCQIRGTANYRNHNLDKLERSPRLAAFLKYQYRTQTTKPIRSITKIPISTNPTIRGEM